MSRGAASHCFRGFRGIGPGLGALGAVLALSCTQAIHQAAPDASQSIDGGAGETAPPRMPEAAIPDDLLAATELIGKVHAVNDDGRIFVIEYKDAVIPVFVPVANLTAGLYRNDKIHLVFQFAMNPPRPTHL